MAIWFSLFISMIFIQVPNLLAINKSSTTMTLYSAFIVGLCVIPTGLIANTMMSYFYGVGATKYSYVALTVGTYAASLIISTIIQIFVLKNKDFLIADYLAVFFVLVGLLTMIYRVEINKLLN